MQDHIRTLSTPSFVRAASVGAVLLALAFAWFSVRWQIGDLVVDVTSAGSPDAAEIAETAIALAPSSPRGYWLAGSIFKTKFDDDSLVAAIGRYEDAVRRSPYHYRAWAEFGRVNEQAGRFDQADAAFRESIRLAPEYAIPHWQAGNFYLRRGRTPDAIVELGLAARHSSPYTVQVFATAWNVLGQDPRQVEQFLTDSADSKAALASFYASLDRPDDAVRIWNRIEPSDKPRFQPQVAAMARALLAHRSYRGALEFSRQAGFDPDARPETLTNGDFEIPIKAGDAEMRFDWRLSRLDGKIDVSADSSTSHGGRRSLKFAVRGYSKPPFHVLSQAIAVSPGGRYSLAFWIRTENLRGGSLPFIEVRNGKNDQMIASSPPFKSGTNEWQEVLIEFTVPPERDSVYLISGREPCPDECPMTGTFWLDDFSLTRSD